MTFLHFFPGWTSFLSSCCHISFPKFQTFPTQLGLRSVSLEMNIVRTIIFTLLRDIIQLYIIYIQHPWYILLLLVAFSIPDVFPCYFFWFTMHPILTMADRGMVGFNGTVVSSRAGERTTMCGRSSDGWRFADLQAGWTWWWLEFPWVFSGKMMW